MIPTLPWMEEPEEVKRIVSFVQFLLKHKQHIWKAPDRHTCWFDVHPFQIVVCDTRDSGQSVMELQIYMADPILGLDPPGQIARDSVLWWKEGKGALVWREPAGLFETLGTVAPLEAIAWAAR